MGSEFDFSIRVMAPDPDTLKKACAKLAESFDGALLPGAVWRGVNVFVGEMSARYGDHISIMGFTRPVSKEFTGTYFLIKWVHTSAGLLGAGTFMLLDGKEVYGDESEPVYEEDGGDEYERIIQINEHKCDIAPGFLPSVVEGWGNTDTDKLNEEKAPKIIGEDAPF